MLKWEPSILFLSLHFQQLIYFPTYKRNYNTSSNAKLSATYFRSVVCCLEWIGVEFNDNTCLSGHVWSLNNPSSIPLLGLYIWNLPALSLVCIYETLPLYFWSVWVRPCHSIIGLYPWNLDILFLVLHLYNLTIPPLACICEDLPLYLWSVAVKSCHPITALDLWSSLWFCTTLSLACVLQTVTF